MCLTHTTNSLTLFLLEVSKSRRVSNYTERFVSDKTIKGFMDTPTTSEQLKFHQMSQEYDRNLYVPYDLPISKTIYLSMRVESLVLKVIL